VITGRGPGAPSVTPDMVFTLQPNARSEPGKPAIDLSAIRRSEAILNLLGARRLLRPRALHDPAIVLLGVLAADVDSVESAIPAALAARSRAARAAAVAGIAVAGAAAGPPEGRTGSAGAWVHVAAVAATIATVAGVAGGTGNVVAGMLARITRLPGAVRREPVGWGWRPPVTGRHASPRTHRPR
jgi:hypothetical protein